MRCKEHVSCMKGEKFTENYVGKPYGKRPLDREVE